MKTAMLTIVLILLCSAPVLQAAPLTLQERQEIADNAYAAGKHRKAFREYRTLAKRGDTFAQYQLSYMYFHGEGTEKDLEKAYSWAVLAAESNNPDVMAYEKAVFSSLPEAQQEKAIEEAQVLMGQYGQLAIAEKSLKAIQRERRVCTGSRVGNSCRQVEYSDGSSMLLGGNGGISAAEAAAGGGAGVGGANTLGVAGGSSQKNDKYHQDLREAEIALTDVIEKNIDGTVELREFEVIDEENEADAEDESSSDGN